MKKEHNVIIYSTHSCPWCHRAVEFFKENDIKFKQIFVDEDNNAAREMIKKSGQRGVPVIDIDGKIIIGYNVESFKKLLEI
jgi:glutaredoxin-like YruB-family protein